MPVTSLFSSAWQHHIVLTPTGSKKKLTKKEERERERGYNHRTAKTSHLFPSGDCHIVFTEMSPEARSAMRINSVYEINEWTKCNKIIIAFYHRQTLYKLHLGGRHHPSTRMRPNPFWSSLAARNDERQQTGQWHNCLHNQITNSNSKNLPIHGRRWSVYSAKTCTS